MRTTFVVRWAALLFSAGLIACGSGGGDSGSPAPAAPAPAAPGSTAQQGVFIDAAVQGLGFTSGSFTGRTDANGRFDYRTGEIVTFTLGRSTLGSVPGGAVVTPLTLAGTSDETDQRVINVARFLQSLDADRNPENGIVLDDAVQSAADLFGPINFNQSTAAFALDPAVLGLLRQARGPAATLVTTERALGHLRDATFRYRYPGIWRLTFTDGTGDFAIDNDGRVRGSAVHQGKTLALLGYVAGNGGIAIYAVDPAHPATQQYPTAIISVGRFAGRLVDTGNAQGTLIIEQAANQLADAGAWAAVRSLPTFDLGIRADLAAIIERFHRTLPASMRYEFVTEERRAPTGELLSQWWLAQGNACNQRRIARGEAPAPLPGLDALRVMDSQRFTGVYRQGRLVFRNYFTNLLFDRVNTCSFTLTPFVAEFFRSDTDDTLYSPQLPGSVLPFATPRGALLSVVPQQSLIDLGELTAETSTVGEARCLWTPNKDGTVELNRVLQGRNCVVVFDEFVVIYGALFVVPSRAERDGSYDPTLPNDPSNTARTTTSISLQLNPFVSDDEVTPPVLRAR